MNTAKLFVRQLILVGLSFYAVASGSAQVINLSAQAASQAAYDPSRNVLYVPLTSASKLDIVDFNTNNISGQIGTLLGPVGVDINAANTRVCVTNANAKTVQLIDLSTQASIASYNINFITNHVMYECAFTASGKVVFGFSDNGSGSPTFTQLARWDPVGGTLSTFGFNLQEPHYVRRSADGQTYGAFEWNANPARAVLYNSADTQVATNSSVPTDYVGTVPSNPGYNSMAINDDGTTVFAGKAIYPRALTTGITLSQYAAPIFLRDGSIIALSNKVSNTFTQWTRMSGQTGAVLASGNLPVSVSALPSSFLVRTTHSTTAYGNDRVTVVDRAAPKTVTFTLPINLPAAAQDWQTYE
jgi:hypothetical protein